MKLVEAGVTAGDIVDMRSFENAIMVHAAISGSTNALMHIPAHCPRVRLRDRRRHL